MKLTKSISSHDIAHLYEHLFFISLDTVLREEKLYPVIDYSINAYTEDGVVTFDIETYRDIDLETIVAEAREYFLDPTELLDIARRQLEAEYVKAITINDPRETIRILHNINHSAWNETAIINIPDSLLNFGDPVGINSLHLKITTSTVPQDLKPLFRIVAGVAVNTIASDIADTFGGFVANEAFEVDADKSLVARVLLSEKADVDEVDNLTKETVDELAVSGAYHRLIDDLKDINGMQYPPSQDKTLEDTGILMDSAKWTELAIQENLTAVTELLEIKVGYTK